MICRVCERSASIEVVDLGEQYLSGYFPSPGEVVPKSRLRLVACRMCGLVQLDSNVPPSMLYGDSYGYRSSLNKSMVSHLSELASKVKYYAELEPNDLIVDIGSNDGTFLKNFTCKKIGIDPTAKKYREFYDKDTEVIPHLFHKTYIPRRAKAITSIAMFYDLEDPIKFAMDVYQSLDHGGIWAIEVANFPKLMAQGIYDNICHEHIEYYGIRQLKLILEKTGFSIIDVSYNDVNGGSIQVIASKSQSGTEFEVSLEPTNRDYDRYTRKVESHALRLREVVREYKPAGFGASTKGNTVLQYCGFTKNDIPFIVDVNPDKWGKETPGSHIPIVKEGQAEHYLVLPWHFRDNILANNPDKNFIFPFPNVEVLDAVHTV